MEMKGAAMSELEKTAPNEIYLIIGDTDKDCNFNELSEVTWADMPIYEETAIKYVKSYQLTIPQSIADELDKRWEAQNKYLQRKVTVPRDALYNAVNPYDNQLAATKIGKWIDENQNICFAYLAGKALGVDVVKVVEG